MLTLNVLRLKEKLAFNVQFFAKFYGLNVMNVKIFSNCFKWKDTDSSSCMLSK